MKLSVACSSPSIAMHTESETIMSTHRKAISGHGTVSMSLFEVDSDERGRDGHIITAKAKSGGKPIVVYESETMHVPSHWDRKRVVNEAWFWVHEKLGIDYMFRSDLVGGE